MWLDFDVRDKCRWTMYLEEVLLWIMDSYCSKKQWFEVKHFFMDLFPLLASPDVNWWTGVWIIVDYTTGPLNAWIWLADESKRMVNVVPGSSLARFTVPYHSAKWFLLFQRCYNRKITKTNNETGQISKYSKQKDKIDRSCPWFCHSYVLLCTESSTLSLSRSLSLPHRHTYNVSLHTR